MKLPVKRPHKLLSESESLVVCTLLCIAEGSAVGGKSDDDATEGDADTDNVNDDDVEEDSKNDDEWKNFNPMRKGSKDKRDYNEGNNIDVRNIALLCTLPFLLVLRCIGQQIYGVAGQTKPARDVSIKFCKTVLCTSNYIVLVKM